MAHVDQERSICRPSCASPRHPEDPDAKAPTLTFPNLSQAPRVVHAESHAFATKDAHAAESKGEGR